MYWQNIKSLTVQADTDFAVYYNVTAKINDSHSAHEISLFFTFTLFCALPRMMEPYDFQTWYPGGIRSFVAAGANHYVATFDETTVLKFPVVPREERRKHPDEV